MGLFRLFGLTIMLLFASSTLKLAANGLVFFSQNPKTKKVYVLLGLDRRDGGYWSDFGGSPEKGEKPWESAAREGAEETALLFDDIKTTISYIKAKKFNITKTTTYKKILSAITPGTLSVGKEYQLFFVRWDDVTTHMCSQQAPVTFHQHFNQIKASKFKENLTIEWFPIGQVMAAAEHKLSLPVNRKGKTHTFPIGGRLMKKLMSLKKNKIFIS